MAGEFKRVCVMLTTTDRGDSPVRRNRSATMMTIPSTQTPASGAPSRTVPSVSTPRNITEPISSAAAAALSSHLAASTGNTQIDISSPDTSTTFKRPRLASSKTSHARVQSWPSPPPAMVPTIPSAPSVPTRGSLDYPDGDPLFPATQVNLLLYTYRPNNLPLNNQQPSPLPSLQPAKTIVSTVHLAHSALPWRVQTGDYLEIRRIHRSEPHSLSRQRGMGVGPNGPMDGKVTGGEALKRVKGEGRDTYIFRVGEDCPNVPINQIQVPESVASAFRLQHRSEVEVVKVFWASRV